MGGEPDTAGSRPAVDVVVPFRGSRDELAAVLATLAGLRRREGDTVTVVENGPSAPAMAAPAGVGLIHARERPTSYHARNSGAAGGDNEWLLFLDADVYPEADLLDRYFSPAPGPRVAILAGGVRDERPACLSQVTAASRFAAERGPMSHTVPLQDERWGYGQTANCAFRRSAFEEYGGFNASVRSGGDADLCFRMREQGWELAERPEAMVVHQNRDTVRALLRQRVRHGSGAAWLNRTHPGSMPHNRRLGAVWWSTRRLASATCHALRSPRDRAKMDAIETLLYWAFECGRVLPNAPKAVDASRVATRRRLRITLMVDSFPVLSETFVTTEAVEMSRAGHLISVEAFVRPAAPGDPRGVPVRYVTDEGLASRLLDTAWLLARHPLGCLKDLASRRRWRDEEIVLPLRALAGRARRAARDGVDHLHVHFASQSALEARRIGALVDVPFSVTAHAYEIFASPSNLRAKLDAAAFVTTGCEYNARHLRKLVTDPDRIHVIVMGVDADRFRRREPPPDAGRVLAVGRLVEKKGFAVLVRALSLLRGHANVTRATIVGDGPLRRSLERLAIELEVPNVDFAGSRTTEDVRALMEESDVLVMPCVVAENGDRDSMPVVCKEALAMEVPVVASHEVGLPELIKPGWGRLTPPGRPAPLAAAITELLHLPARERAAMGAAGREWVEHHCNARLETARLLRLIEAHQPHGPAGHSR